MVASTPDSPLASPSHLPDEPSTSNRSPAPRISPDDMKAGPKHSEHIEDATQQPSPHRTDSMSLVEKGALAQPGGLLDGAVTKDGSGKDVETELMETQEDVFPDGGLRAWLVVLGAFLVSATSYGLVNSWGVFQAYYRENQLSDSSPDAVAWIGSLQICLVLGCGLFVGRAFDHGHLKSIFAVAIVIYCAGLFSVPHCKTYWQFFLAQGIACGLGPGISFITAIGCISHWFKKRRSAALGIFSSGAAVGGVVYPILLRNAFRTVGFAWAVRAVGFLTLGLLLIATFALKQRLPPRHGGRFFDIRVFSDPVYSLLTVGAALTMMGFYIPILFAQVASRANGNSDSVSSYILAIISGASGVGRIAPNYLADSIGPINVLVVNTCLNALMCFLFYPLLRSNGGAIAFAIIFGFATGCQVSIIPPCIASITEEMNTIGIRMSMCYIVVAIVALPGPPLAGLIVSHTGSYLGAACLAGGLVTAGLCLFSCARILAARRKKTPWV